MKVSNNRFKALRAAAKKSRPKRRCVICKRLYLYSRKDQITCAREECVQQRKSNTNWELHQENRIERNERQRTQHARLVALAAKALAAGNGAEQKPKGKPGRKPEAEENKSYWKIGEKVEKLIPIDLEQDRHTVITARRSVSDTTGLPYDLVAQYHKEYRLTRSRNASA
jgi:hypothetical protein